MSLTGVIIKGVGSFYYVDTAFGQTVRCRLRGNLRVKELTPAVGDKVSLETREIGDAVITEILPRNNLILRPYIANAQTGVIVASAVSPDISFLLTDKMLVQLRLNSLNGILVINKCDLAKESLLSEIKEIYAQSEVKIVFTSVPENRGIDELKQLTDKTISVFSGVSGAGKSSIIKALTDNESIETGEISVKSQKGKHTTRHSELIRCSEGTYIADTPGFSRLTLFTLSETEIWRYYPEFLPYSDCRYSSCIHVNEPDCEVKKAVSENKINKTRYYNYTLLIKEAQNNRKNLY